MCGTEARPFRHETVRKGDQFPSFPVRRGLATLRTVVIEQRSYWEASLKRRDFLGLSSATVLASMLPAGAVADEANVPTPFDWTIDPPEAKLDDYINWMVKNRAEDPRFLRLRFERFQALQRNQDVWDQPDRRAFLMTPREEFCLKANWPRVYDNAFLDIGYGVTISGPHLVGRMTSTLGVKKGDKVMEIGTGSGYQSAYLSHLTDKVWTIEIIKPLAERTRATYDALIGRGYAELKAISTKNADGYYGWEENAPFDKIIVTCGIDHIPPPLLQQLKPDGIMVIPVGPPGAQHVLKVEKTVGTDGSVAVKRTDIYKGRIVPFVPFTKLEGDSIKGTHNQ
jgi:protein-L-isoaspartate(D-aspartate) O-methyltransferase